MGDDVSDKTITILVVLTVVISILSTLAVINAVNRITQHQPATTTESEKGKVSLTVTGDSKPKTAVAHTTTTGRITFKVTTNNISKAGNTTQQEDKLQNNTEKTTSIYLGDDNNYTVPLPSEEQ